MFSHGYLENHCFLGFTLNYLQLLCLVASVVCGPQSSFPRIDVQRYVTKALKGYYPTDNRVKASTNLKAPSTVAALAYVKSVVKEGLCGQAAEAYLESIVSGESIEEATAGATKAYITSFSYFGFHQCLAWS